jgi:hypothetical protein
MSEAVIRRCDFRIRTRNKYATCNEEVEDNEPTVFSFDNAYYSADLCSEHKLRAQEVPLAELIAISRPEYVKTGGRIRRMILGHSGDVTTAKVREWLRENDYDVPDTGAIRKDLWAVWNEAHPEEARA